MKRIHKIKLIDCLSHLGHYSLSRGAETMLNPRQRVISVFRNWTQLGDGKGCKVIEKFLAWNAEIQRKSQLRWSVAWSV